MKIIVIILSILLVLFILYVIGKMILINKIMNSNDHGLRFLMSVVPEIKKGFNVKKAIINYLDELDVDLKIKIKSDLNTTINENIPTEILVVRCAQILQTRMATEAGLPSDSFIEMVEDIKVRYPIVYKDIMEL